MKWILSSLFLFLVTKTNAQHSLTKIWETDSIVAIPESVLYDSKKVMYVSLIDGAPWETDGKGGIAKISAKGKKYNGSWITGLHAPKGMGLKGRELYIADMAEVVVVDTKKGTILNRITVPGAQGLNDITIAQSGSVFVSDSRTGRIWKIDNNQPQLFMDSVQGVNGLKAVGEDLIVAAGKSFIRVSPQKVVTKIAELPQGGDGIEPVGNGEYLVSSWVGYVYYVNSDGRVETLLNTTGEKKNTADIGYDANKRILYIPTFFGKTVSAYKLN